jgi:hypothetical protein
LPAREAERMSPAGALFQWRKSPRSSS